MFGSNKNKEKIQEQERESWAMHMMMEQYKQIVVEMGDIHREGTAIFSEAVASQAEFEERKGQFDVDTGRLRESAMGLQSKIDALAEQMGAVENEILKIEGDMDQMMKELSEQKENVLHSMDISKHVTTPVKNLKEAIERIKRQQKMHEQKKPTEEIDNGAKKIAKQIEAMSLTAAIEAGRFGEDGTKFVETAQEIRTAAIACQKACEIEKPAEEVPIPILDLENNMNELISILKNNSVLLGQMSKSEESKTPQNILLKNQFEDLKKKVHEMKDNSAAVVDTGNEISMDGERMAEAFTTSKSAEKEMESIFDHMQTVLKNLTENGETKADN